MSLVDSAGTEHGKYKIPDKLFTQIVDIDLVRAGSQCLLAHRIKLVSLPQVGRESHYLAAVLVFKPLEDNRGIQTT